MQTTSQRLFNVLFLCTGNSARSIIGEALLNYWGGQGNRFKAYSAGSMSTGQVNHYALDILKRLNIPLKEEPRSKSWDEFAGPDAPYMDFVFTVCDSAANEVCPIWPGQPMSAHWGVADPAAVEGDETDKVNAFRTAFRELENRIKIFTSLPIHQLDKIRLQEHLDEIGKSKADETESAP
jgi:arsenate reductase